MDSLLYLVYITTYIQKSVIELREDYKKGKPISHRLKLIKGALKQAEEEIENTYANVEFKDIVERLDDGRENN